MKIVTPDDKWKILSTLKKYKMVMPTYESYNFYVQKDDIVKIEEDLVLQWIMIDVEMRASIPVAWKT